MSINGPPIVTFQTKYPPTGPQLEPVARLHICGKVGRDLAAFNALDRQDHRRALRRGRDRIAALGLITVGARQAKVVMLAGFVRHPRRKRQRKRLGLFSLYVDVCDCRDLPLERRHPSIPAIALFLPGIPMDVIAERPPKPRLILIHKA